VGAGAPTDSLSYQVGPVASDSDILNGIKVECNNLQPKGIKYTKLADALGVALNAAKCTATSAAAEFKLTFN
jgi:hypothetical protein